VPDALIPAQVLILLAGLFRRGIPENFAAPAARPTGVLSAIIMEQI